MRSEIEFLPSGKTIVVEDDETTLLDATRKAGLPIASACGANGACARCGLLVVEGTETLEPETEREIRIKERNRIDANLRLACRVKPRGDLKVSARYW